MFNSSSNSSKEEHESQWSGVSQFVTLKSSMHDDDFFKYYKECYLKLKNLLNRVLSDDKKKWPHLRQACDNIEMALENSFPNENEGLLKALLELMPDEIELARKDTQFLGKTSGQEFADKLEALSRTYFLMISPHSEHQEASYRRLKNDNAQLIRLIEGSQQTVLELQQKVLDLTTEKGDLHREYADKATDALQGVSVQLQQFNLMVNSKKNTAITDGSEKKSGPISSNEGGSSIVNIDELKAHKESFKKGMSAKRHAVIKVLSAFIPEPTNFSNTTDIKLRPTVKLSILPTQNQGSRDAAKKLSMALLEDTVYLGGKSTEAIINKFGQGLSEDLKSTLSQITLSDSLNELNQDDLKTPLLAFRTNRFLEYARDAKYFLVFHDQKQHDRFEALYKDEVKQQSVPEHGF